MSWLERALQFLSSSAVDGAWGYRPGSSASAEPTAMALLALRAHGRPAASDYLAQLQAADGSIGLSKDLPSPGWPTPLAIMAWSSQGGADEPIKRGVRYLLGLEGKTFPNTDVVGQNTELVGWPWVSETHTWLEPTAYCVIALTRAGYGTHGRVLEGRRVILDRICAGGGWNYGCPAQLGNNAQAFPAPTGIALLALRDRRDDAALRESIEFLAKRVPATRAPMSLSWGLLGLAAMGRRPAEGETWLGESFSKLEARGLRTLEVALLTLAAAPAAALEWIAVPGGDR